MKRVITFCVFILSLELVAALPFPEELLAALQSPRTSQYNFAQSQTQNLNQGSFENVGSYPRQPNSAYSRGTPREIQYANTGYPQNTQRHDFLNRESIPLQRNNFENYFRHDSATSQASQSQTIEQIQEQIRQQSAQNQHIGNKMRTQDAPQNQYFQKNYPITYQAPSKDQIQERIQEQTHEHQVPKTNNEYSLNQRSQENLPWNYPSTLQIPSQTEIQEQIHEQKVQNLLNDRLPSKTNAPLSDNLQWSNSKKSEVASEGKIQEQFQEQLLQQVLNENLANKLRHQNLPQIQNFRKFDSISPQAPSLEQIQKQQNLNENLANQIKIKENNVHQIQNFQQLGLNALQTQLQDQIKEQIQEQILEKQHLTKNDPQILNHYNSVEPDNTPLIPIKTFPESYMNPVPSSYLRNNFENIRSVPQKEQYLATEQQLPLITRAQNGWIKDAVENRFELTGIQEPYQNSQVSEVQPTQSNIFQSLMALLNSQQQNTADSSEKKIRNDIVLNHPNIKDILATTKPEKRYLVVHPDGTIEQVDELGLIAEKYPNYFLVNTGTVGQEEPKTLAEVSAEVALLSALAEPETEITPVYSPEIPVAPSLYTDTRDPMPFNPVAFLDGIAATTGQTDRVSSSNLPNSLTATPSISAALEDSSTLTDSTFPSLLATSAVLTTPVVPINLTIPLNPGLPNKPASVAPAVRVTPSITDTLKIPAIPATSTTSTLAPTTTTTGTSLFTSVVEATKTLTSVSTDAIQILKNLTNTALNAGALQTTTAPATLDAAPFPSNGYPAPTESPNITAQDTPATSVPLSTSTIECCTQAPSNTPTTASAASTTGKPVTFKTESKSSTALASAQSTQNISSTTKTVSSYISNTSKESNSSQDSKTSIGENSSTLDLSKVKTTGEPVVWFKTSDFDLWNKLVGEDKYSVLYFFQVPSSTIVEKDTKTTILANGTVIEEVTELIKDPEQDEPVINHTIKITDPEGQIITEE